MATNELSPEAFKQLVDDDIRNSAAPGDAQLLRDPANVERWHGVLLAMKQNVEAQLTRNRLKATAQEAQLREHHANRATILSYRADHDRWRYAAITFKNGVEERLREAKRLLADLRAKTPLSLVILERDNAVREIARLHRAILDHRDAVGDDGEEADDQLWALVDNDAIVR